MYQDNVLGLQFHIEMDGEAVGEIVRACNDELVDGEHVQDTGTILDGTKRYFPKQSLFELLDNWLKN